MASLAYSRHRLRYTWHDMLARCENPRTKAYRNYGARGIMVCERWHRFEAFRDDMGERPSDTHSLDRIDNDGGYSAENCRWATALEQHRNKRTNRMLEWRGESRTLADWSRAVGMSPATITKRLRVGWSVGRALSETPVSQEPRVFACGGITATLREWSERTGICVETLDYRVRAGWSIEDTMSVSPTRTREGNSWAFHTMHCSPDAS